MWLYNDATYLTEVKLGRGTIKILLVKFFLMIPFFRTKLRSCTCHNNHEPNMMVLFLLCICREIRSCFCINSNPDNCSYILPSFCICWYVFWSSSYKLDSGSYLLFSCSLNYYKCNALLVCKQVWQGLGFFSFAIWIASEQNSSWDSPCLWEYQFHSISMSTLLLQALARYTRTQDG
jgi:hypothetical protein